MRHQGGFGDILYVSKRDRLYVTPMQVTNSLSPTDIHSMGTNGDRLCVVKRKEINLKKTEEGVRKIVVRFNPQSSALDGVILTKIECLPVAASHLAKMLLVDYFSRQSGGLGLSSYEMKMFAEMSPRFANKKRKDLFPDGTPDHDKPQKVESKKHKESDGNSTLTKVADAKVEARAVAAGDIKGSNVVVPGSGRPPWGPGNLPPGFDTSDFEDFVG